MRARSDDEVAPPFGVGALDVRIPGGATLAVALRHLVTAKAILRRRPVVEVEVAAVAHLAACRQEGLRQFIHVGNVRVGHGAAHAVVLRCAVLGVVLSLTIVLKHLMGRRWRLGGARGKRARADKRGGGGRGRDGKMAEGESEAKEAKVDSRKIAPAGGRVGGQRHSSGTRHQKSTMGQPGMHAHRAATTCSHAASVNCAG